ncbi:MAG TPA: hypothetical protein VH575_07730 [Gemmataceae bacterium]|jgi:hypothetical protein
MTSYVLGLDLGQTKDFTALAVLERHPVRATEKPDYALRHLRRFPLGTAYTDIVPAVAALRRSEPLRQAPLVVDQTGVGRAVVDMLRQSASGVIPVTITGGHATTVTADGSYHMPKKELITALQVVMQGRRLQIARSLPEAATLVRELQQFQVKITAAANETFGVWRDGQHDDLVLAVALACWWSERVPPFEAPTVIPFPPRQGLLERMVSGRSRAEERGLFGLGRHNRIDFL